MTDQDEWWCALCPTSHPSEEALIAHKAAKHPTTAAGTSAQLRQAQTALAASQADLTRVERERDQFRDNYLRDAARLDQARDDLCRMEIERDDARAELEQLRAATGWIVARDGGRDCAACDQEIRRGEAYQLLATADELEHIRCPALKEPPMADWQRSSFCGNTTCVEVLVRPDEVLVRDGKNRLQHPLKFSVEEWNAFVAGVQAGEFGGGAT